jgi:hypothetical protein
MLTWHSDSPSDQSATTPINNGHFPKVMSRGKITRTNEWGSPQVQTDVVDFDGIAGDVYLFHMSLHVSPYLGVQG